MYYFSAKELKGLIHLKSIEIRGIPEGRVCEFPFSIPLIRSFSELQLNCPVTILVGENGTGKSTLLEGIAAAVGSITVGNDSIEFDKTLEHARRLSKYIKLTWNIKTKKGFFLRSEDFFNYARKISELKSEMETRLGELDEEYKNKSDYALSYARMPYAASLYQMKEMYGDGLDANSHGEGFLKLFQSRFVPGGLYILDEPEVPLSPMRQLAFISMIKEMIKENSQFIIATHSPILMAFPEAEIVSFDQSPFKRVKYDELEHVKLTRDFLNNPEQFLRHL